MSDLIVLTGERGVGKTTVCRQTVGLARAKGYRCGGILTLRRDGVRDVLDVGSGESRRLTQREGAGRRVIQGRYSFDPQTLKWGEALLSEAAPSDLLVIDEIGPLEIERSRGWVAAFDVLRRMSYAVALVVVRPELVVQAQLRLPSSATVVLSVTEENRDELPATLLKMLEQRTPSVGA